MRNNRSILKRIFAVLSLAAVLVLLASQAAFAPPPPTPPPPGFPPKPPTVDPPPPEGACFRVEPRELGTVTGEAGWKVIRYVVVSIEARDPAAEYTIDVIAVPVPPAPEMPTPVGLPEGNVVP
jgi:hypothetical protein